VSAPELSVVCKSCGSEVSPYVTECPYCGHRLRKRAPELEREGDEIRVRESGRERRRREKRARRAEREQRRGERPRRRTIGSLDVGSRPVATISVLAIAAILLILQRAVPWSAADVGAIVGPVDSEPWRYLVAPFVYDDLGALIVTAAAIGILGTAVERRIGSLATLTLIIACGSGGMLAADAAAGLGLDDFLVAAGGNGVALGLLGAWLMLWRAEARGGGAEPLDVIGVSVIAIVLLLLPLVEAAADPIAGVVGGLLGVLLGLVAGARIPAGT
jgi:membrane associated rhomboid family serine protease